MDYSYYVIAKTGASELRALANLSEDVTKKIMPILELTRGRKVTSKTDRSIVSYPYDKILDRVKEIFRGCDIVLDLTSDPQLLSLEIKDLYNPANGYVNWITLLKSLKSENVFASITPSIILNYDDESFEENAKQQIITLAKEFKHLMYRFTIDNEVAIEDIEQIVEYLPDDTELIVVVDCEYVPTSSYTTVIPTCKSLIKEVDEVLKGRKYKVVLASTTFPNNVTETNDDFSDTIDLREIDIFKSVKDEFSDIYYADYGSINPRRNDVIMMPRGWIPRIDVALEKSIFYYRIRRPKGITAYSTTYIRVAQTTLADERFPMSDVGIWGIRQILDCSSGSIPSSAPSFWISVRMNTHISQQIKRMAL